jgi:hypothetical protein
MSGMQTHAANTPGNGAATVTNADSAKRRKAAASPARQNGQAQAPTSQPPAQGKGAQTGTGRSQAANGAAVADGPAKAGQPPPEDDDDVEYGTEDSSADDESGDGDSDAGESDSGGGGGSGDESDDESDAASSSDSGALGSGDSGPVSDTELHVAGAAPVAKGASTAERWAHLKGVRIVDDLEADNAAMSAVKDLLRARRYHDDEIAAAPAASLQITRCAPQQRCLP